MPWLALHLEMIGANFFYVLCKALLFLDGVIFLLSVRLTGLRFLADDFVPILDGMTEPSPLFAAAVFVSGRSLLSGLPDDRSKILP